MSKPAAPTIVPAPTHDEMVMREMQRRSRRSFLIGGAAALAGIAGFRWLSRSPQDDGARVALRRMLELNERIATGYISPSHLSHLYPADLAGMPRRNGMYGLHAPLDESGWRLAVSGAEDGERMLGLDDLRSLPHVEHITELRCIEGWSQVVRWGGVRLADFTARFAFPSSGGAADRLVETLPRYISIVTPDNGYYVGLDIESAMHPQTLLCYEMNGRPLLPDHGAPLRLVVPVKYGIKNIKRIGAIRYTNTRPADFWAKQGYDWFAGL